MGKPIGIVVFGRRQPASRVLPAEVQAEQARALDIPKAIEQPATVAVPESPGTLEAAKPVEDSADPAARISKREKRRRARNDEGHFVADDPITPEANEAFEAEPEAEGASPINSEAPTA